MSNSDLPKLRPEPEFKAVYLANGQLFETREEAEESINRKFVEDCMDCFCTEEECFDIRQFESALEENSELCNALLEYIQARINAKRKKEAEVLYEVPPHQTPFTDDTHDSDIPF